MRLRLAWPTPALALLLALAVSPLARALPQAAAVPGGVVIVRLGAATGTAPQAWLGEQLLWVKREKGEWLAVVGIGLETIPGDHELRVEGGNGERRVHFSVVDKRYPHQHIKLKDAGKVNLSPRDEARALAEIDEIRKLKRYWREDREANGDFILPAPGRLSSRFGLRRVFNGEARAPHSGLDLALARGTPVGASASGRVLAIGDYFFNGKTVFVDHGNGLITMYCHLDGIEVTAGMALAQGERIGVSGMSGRASGPHLHWSVFLNGAAVDPQLFVRPVL